MLNIEAIQQGSSEQDSETLLFQADASPLTLSGHSTPTSIPHLLFTG